MMSCFKLYVVAQRRFTRNHIIVGIFPNDRYALEFRNAFCQSAKIFICDYNDIIYSEFGVELKKSLSPIEI